MCDNPDHEAAVKQVYVQELMARMDSDKKMIMLMIAFILAVVVFTGKEILLSTQLASLSHNMKVALSIALASLLLSAFCYFLYYRRVHLNEVALVQFLIEGTKEDARDRIFCPTNGLWAKHGQKYEAGNFFLTVGFLFYLGFFVAVIFS